uniref:Uncharacterized protein n=1 Tax=Oryza sativa subsp. japonica TaxID=39947 RepID=Q6K4I2_ORYSJ|nr:hypothetical protein [Oryza sativa Japonica Group]
MEEEKGMMGKQEKEKVLLQAAYDGNLRLLRNRWKSTTLHPRGAGAVSPRRASVPPAPLSLSRREPAPPTASTGDGASHRILLRRCLPPHPPASPPPLGSRCRHRRRLTSDLPEQPLVDASAAATDFPGAAFLPPSADIRHNRPRGLAPSGDVGPEGDVFALLLAPPRGSSRTRLGPEGRGAPTPRGFSLRVYGLDRSDRGLGGDRRSDARLAPSRQDEGF